MTATLTWRPTGPAKQWADTGQDADRELTDPREGQPSPADGAFAADSGWRRAPAEMVEDLPRSLVEAYARRACDHARIREADPGVWFASVIGLDGAWGDGGNSDEALSELYEAIIGWVAVRRRLDLHIPSIDGLDLNIPSHSRPA